MLSRGQILLGVNLLGSGLTGCLGISGRLLERGSLRGMITPVDIAANMGVVLNVTTCSQNLVVVLMMTQIC
jgi:hypothetical protein